MQSSFRKFNLGDNYSFPIRQVHEQNKTSPSPSSSNRSLLVSLEQRLSDLRQGLEDRYQQQMKMGWDAGYQAGHQEGRKDAEALVRQAAQELELVRAEKLEHTRKYKEQIIDLVVTICNKLLLDQVVQPENTLHLIEDALAKLHPPLDALIFCHPTRIEDIQGATEHLSTVARGNVEIVADPLLPVHAIRVESENSVLEINITKELEKISREMGVELGI